MMKIRTLLSLYSAAVILSACGGSNGDALSEKDIVGNYVFVASDEGAPHAEETLIIYEERACFYRDDLAECYPVKIIKGDEVTVVIGNRGFSVERHGTIRLVEDRDMGWYFDKVH